MSHDYVGPMTMPTNVNAASDDIGLLPAGQKESAEECLQNVKNVFVELGVDISDDVVS